MSRREIVLRLGRSLCAVNNVVKQRPKYDKSGTLGGGRKTKLSHRDKLEIRRLESTGQKSINAKFNAKSQKKFQCALFTTQ